MKKIILPGIVAGIGMAIIGFILNFLFGWIFPSFQAIYTDTTIFIAMDTARSALFWIYPLVLGIGLAWLYTVINDNFKRPLAFAGIYFVIGALPAFFINVGSFNLPVMMVVSWTIMSYLNGLVAAYVFKWMIK